MEKLNFSYNSLFFHANNFALKAIKVKINFKWPTVIVKSLIIIWKLDFFVIQAISLKSMKKVLGFLERIDNFLRD